MYSIDTTGVSYTEFVVLSFYYIWSIMNSRHFEGEHTQ